MTRSVYRILPYNDAERKNLPSASDSTERRSFSYPLLYRFFSVFFLFDDSFGSFHGKKQNTDTNCQQYRKQSKFINRSKERFQPAADIDSEFIHETADSEGQHQQGAVNDKLDRFSLFAVVLDPDRDHHRHQQNDHDRHHYGCGKDIREHLSPVAAEQDDCRRGNDSKDRAQQAEADAGRLGLPDISEYARITLVMMKIPAAQN